MNYNDNGEVKQITVKAGDTLPVGTEVDVPLDTTTSSGYVDVPAMLIENASIQVAGQLDLQSYGITNEYFVLSAYAPGYVLIPFVYGARWFLKVLDTSLSPVSAGTSITFTLKYEKSSKKIRKTYNGVVPNGKILNSYSTSQNDGYSCDYINNEFDDVNTILTNLNQNAIVYKDTVYKNAYWDNLAMGTYFVNTWTGSGGDGHYPAENIIGMLLVIPSAQVVFSIAKIYVRVKSTTWSAWKSVTLS